MKGKIKIVIRIIKENILIRYLLSKFTLKYVNFISLLNFKFNKKKYFFENNYKFLTKEDLLGSSVSFIGKKI